MSIDSVDQTQHFELIDLLFGHGVVLVLDGGQADGLEGGGAAAPLPRRQTGHPANGADPCKPQNKLKIKLKICNDLLL